MQEMCDKIQEAVRQVSVPVMADGDTGYGSLMNMRRTVESYAIAGAAAVIIEDQTWPKREFLLRSSLGSLILTLLAQAAATQKANPSARAAKPTPA
jgi:2-methylisocitrate lyase-like PEP mutase family enzyme